MRERAAGSRAGKRPTKPELIARATTLASVVRQLSFDQLMRMMRVSRTLADQTHDQFQRWAPEGVGTQAAIDSFLGDIYSGLQVGAWTNEDREYAQLHLRILSGLYGIVRPNDGIAPYRLEMGYSLPGIPQKLHHFWGRSIVDTLPQDELIINLAAVEYARVITDYYDEARVVTPRFLTVSPTTGEPVFVVVHAKIARGSFASWLIRMRISDRTSLKTYDELGYHFEPAMSTPNVPVFVCQKFQGLGLSIRLSQ
jgi:cytoplasmic iron level regulating protein YaaA (DUF328/UPF0246 family)